MAIELLAEDVVAKIAAGEVVERPASVVKELIENSLDAGADAIHIEADDGGRQLIRISDNGSGIRSAEIELAFKRHATSKLRQTDDLQTLSTLGFRGEALASIAAVSRTAVLTRHHGEAQGVSLRLAGGAVQQQQAVGAPAGTIITIENLFYNTPARLKFLHTSKTEKRHIHQTVTRYAMAYPQVSFALTQDGREQFRSSGRGSLADVLAKVFGLGAFKRLLEVAGSETAKGGYPKIELAGYASHPALSRGNRSGMVLFINGRAVQDSALARAITQAYEGMLKAGRHPLAVIMMTMPSDFVDVNVHPTKAEVRFRDAGLVFVAVQRAVRKALMAADDLPDEPQWSDGSSSSSSAPRANTYRQLESDALLDDDADLEYIPEGAEAPVKPRTLPVLRVIGQIGAVYIIAEGPAGLYLVDQNAAHERVLYEQIHADLQAAELAVAALRESQTVLLSPADAQRLSALDGLLGQAGFEIEMFGPNAFVFRVIPQCLSAQPLGDVFPQMLEYLWRTERTVGDLAAALAYVAAVKRGQVLQMDEMQALIRQLERCPSPHQSPTGQTTLIHMTRDHLAREFQRGQQV